MDKDFGIQSLSFFWLFFVLDLSGGSGLNEKSTQGISLIITQLSTLTSANPSLYSKLSFVTYHMWSKYGPYYIVVSMKNWPKWLSTAKNCWRPELLFMAKYSRQFNTNLILFSFSAFHICTFVQISLSGILLQRKINLSFQIIFVNRLSSRILIQDGAIEVLWNAIHRVWYTVGNEIIFLIRLIIDRIRQILVVSSKNIRLP